MVQPESGAFTLRHADANRRALCNRGAHAIRNAICNGNSVPNRHALPDSGANDLAVRSTEKGER